MAEGEFVLPALLQWFNSLRAEKVHSLEEISSGTILWDVLRHIDPEAFSGDLPLSVDPHIPSESWRDNLDNLKHIYDILTAYIVDRCRRRLPLPSGEPDLKAIAQSSSEKEASQLLKLVFLAAIFGRFSMDFIQQLISFSEETQAQFYVILEEPEAIEGEEEVPSPQQKIPMSQDDGKATTSSENVDGKVPELFYEERIAELVAIKKELEHETTELKEQLENMHDLHTKLQKSYDNLEIQQQDTAERLDALRSGKGEQSILNIQRTKMQQQETVIATLESQMHSLREESNDLKNQTDLLRSQSEGFQQMQDDVFELKLERERLQRKANAADKYKQKLQSLQKIEDENETLKYRVTEMQRQLKQSDSDQFSNSDLRRENDEMRRLVSNIEQELADSIEAKKRAEVEKMTLEAKLQQADDQATRWHSRSEELQTFLDESLGPDSPTTPRAPKNGLYLAPSEDDLPQQNSNIGEEMSKMQVDDQNMISEEELHTILKIMKAHTQTVSNSERTSSIQEQQKLAEKIERSRATAGALTQQTKDQSSLIASLRAELAAATDSASATSSVPRPTPSSPTRPDSELESDSRFQEALTQKAILERELQLMTSAWYDQNARLMRNTVSVSMSRGRAPPEPRSFLGRQRRLVDGILTGRS